MTIGRVVGGWGFDERWLDEIGSLDSSITAAGVAFVTANNPALGTEPSSRYSKWGAAGTTDEEYYPAAAGGDGFRAWSSLRYITYEAYASFQIEGSGGAGTETNLYRVIWSVNDGETALATGDVCMAIICARDAPPSPFAWTIDMKMYVYNAGWNSIGPSTELKSGSGTSLQWDGRVMMQFDMNGGDNNIQVRMAYDDLSGGGKTLWTTGGGGDEWISGGNAADILVASLEEAPTWGAVANSAKGALVFNWAYYDILPHESDTLTTGMHAVEGWGSYVPAADSSTYDAWIRSGGNADCDKSYCIDDLRDDDNGADDKLTAGTSGSDTDQGFKIGNAAGNLFTADDDIACVQVVAITEGNAATQGLDHIAYRTDGGTILEKTPIAGFNNNPNGSTRAVMLYTDSEGVAWTYDTLNKTEFIIRANPNAGEVYGVVVHVLGSQDTTAVLTKQANTPACPAAVTFIPRVMMY